MWLLVTGWLEPFASLDATAHLMSVQSTSRFLISWRMLLALSDISSTIRACRALAHGDFLEVYGEVAEVTCKQAILFADQLYSTKSRPYLINMRLKEGVKNISVPITFL